MELTFNLLQRIMAPTECKTSVGAILVMLALMTSWMAGTWIRYVLKSGKRLMPGDENLVVSKPQEEVIFDPLPVAK
jgi:hypothetical protein